MQMAGRFKQAGILKETSAPTASGGDASEARSARAEPRQEHTDAKPATGKSPFDSIEQDLTSLLSRFDKKP